MKKLYVAALLGMVGVTGPVNVSAETKLKQGEIKIGMTVRPRTQVKTEGNRIIISQGFNRGIVFTKTADGHAAPVTNVASPMRIKQLGGPGKRRGVAIDH